MKINNLKARKKAHHKTGQKKKEKKVHYTNTGAPDTWAALPSRTHCLIHPTFGYLPKRFSEGLFQPQGRFSPRASALTLIPLTVMEPKLADFHKIRQGSNPIAPTVPTRREEEVQEDRASQDLV